MEAIRLLGVTLLFCIALAVYLLPSMIADARGTHHTRAIRWMNVIFGWTVIGWFAVLIWSWWGGKSPQREKSPAAF